MFKQQSEMYQIETKYAFVGAARSHLTVYLFASFLEQRK